MLTQLATVYGENGGGGGGRYDGAMLIAMMMMNLALLLRKLWLPHDRYGRRPADALVQGAGVEAGKRVASIASTVDT